MSEWNVHFVYILYLVENYAAHGIELEYKSIVFMCFCYLFSYIPNGLIVFRTTDFERVLMPTK